MDENLTPETTPEETSEVSLTSTEVTTLQFSESTTTTAEITQIDATALNRFTNTAYIFMSFIFVIIVCKALYKLFNIFF